MSATTTLAAFRGVIPEGSVTASEILSGSKSSPVARTCARSSSSAPACQRLSHSSNAVSNSLSFTRGSALFGSDGFRSDLPSGALQASMRSDDRKFHCSAAHAESNAVAAPDFFVDERQLLDLNGATPRVGGREIAVEASRELVEEFNPQGLRYDSEDESGEEYFEEGEVSEGSDVEADPLAVKNLGLCKELEDALVKRGILKLFPIQAAVMEPALAGQDVIARAKTGTGKTLAFGIPILDRITRQNNEVRGRWHGGPRCLVMAPTRELAMQVNRELTESAPHLNTICVYGGVSIEGQIRQLKRGVDIAVGTPGRIIDLIDRGTLVLSDVKFMVLDEADQMLAVGFEEDVERVMQMLPAERQTSLFSATMPSWVNKLSRKYLNNPLTIDLVGADDGKLSDDVKVMAVRAPGASKRSILVDLITVHGKGGKSIVFTQTKRDADEVSLSLGRTVGCQALHGDIAQQQREKTLQAFRDGRFGVLVATDVAARGLDIPNVDLVIHYDIPNDPETFVHRSGRTGRAGKSGSAILMYTDNQTRTLKLIERDLNAQFVRISPPHVDDVLAASAGQAVALIKQVHPELTEVFLETAEQLLKDEGPSALAAAIAHMSGFTQPPASKSLLTYEEGYTTVRVVRSAKSYNGPLTSPRAVMGTLSEILRAAADNVGKIKLISDRNIEGAVFDLPEKIAKELMALTPANGDVFDIPKELPRLIDEPGRNDRGRPDNYGRFSSRGRPSSNRGDRDSRPSQRYGDSRGGGDRFGDRFGDRSGPSRSFDRYGGGGGGGGDRYGSGGGGRAPPRGRSFSTGSWDDFDFLAPQTSAPSRGSGGFSRGGSSGFGGVCFVCKQPGHRAVDCPTGKQ